MTPRRTPPDGVIVTGETVHVGDVSLVIRLRQDRSGALRVVLYEWHVGAALGTLSPLLVLPPSSLPGLVVAFSRIAHRAGAR